MITHLDDCLGRVLAVLEERGELEQTLIVFCGDNGLAVGQHGLMGKQNHYEHSIRVPLILSGPGIRAGQRVDTPVYLFDIFPSLCEHLGMKRPASVEGRSFAPLLKGETCETRDRLYFAYENSLRSVKNGRYKLTRAEVPGRASVVRLYDVETDPWELTDLSRDPGHQLLRAELERDLEELADQWDDRKTPWGRAFWG
jgi:arylsulfatase A-like enzyme